ncbi:TolC family protein [Gemmatimonadota bacterium DH-20]|uniref:TolC family protein n=1 Tax=Gaopeijia maritima TaxID=3119007 RepID=A0ABU9E6W9_9BACT
MIRRLPSVLNGEDVVMNVTRWLTLLFLTMAGAAQAQVAEGPLTLERAVRTALDRNPQLRAARFGLEEAQEQVSEAWSSVFPSLDLSTTYTRNVSPAVNFLPANIFDPTADPNELISVQFGADNTWQLSVNLEQPLFNAAAFIGVGAAGRFEALQQESVRGQAHEVVTRVRESYYGLLLAQEQARLSENSVRRVRASLEETRALNRGGLASDYDVLRLEVELANLEPALRQATNAVAQGRRQLGIDLGLDPEATEALEVAGSLADLDLNDPAGNDSANRELLAFVGVPLGDAPEAGGLAELVATRSDVRQLELTESLRHTEMRLEQVEYMPRLSLFGTYAINSQQNGDPDFFAEPRAYSRNIGVQLTLPIFQGFRRDARIDQKRAALRQAETQTELARSQGVAEVRSLIERADEARDRAAGQGLAVQQATRGFEIARAQYREGLGSQLELTDAEVALRQSEFNYAQAVYDFLVARARLDAAAGRVPLVEDRMGGRDDA